MPDANKFAKLRQIGYTIRPTCGLCKHGSFAGPSDWGTCLLHRYEHLKHENPKGGRGVSICQHGCCPSWETAPFNASVIFGAHQEFFDPKAKPK